MRSLLPGCASPKVLKDGRSNGTGRTHLYLNVYDLTPMNNYLYLFGLGVFHSGIQEFRMFIEDLAGKYHGDTYHLFIKNCNHFTDDVCMHLTGKPIPGWVNRLARLGSFCNCLLPESIQVKAVGNLPAQPALSEDELVSVTSSIVEESDEEDPDHQLLLTPNDDPAHLREKQLRLVKDVQ